MKRTLIICLSILTGVLYYVPAHAQPVAVNKVIQVPGGTQEQLLKKVQTWSERYGRSYNVDPDTGVVVMEGEVVYPSPPIDRIQYSFPFRMKDQVKPNQVVVSFEDVMMKSPGTYISSDSGGPSQFMAGRTEKIKSGKDVAAANESLNKIATNLENYLLGKDNGAMMKCSECDVLTMTPEQMKEHLKRHEHQ